MKEKRNPAKRRVHKPLLPTSTILVVDETGLHELSPDKVSIEKIGLKGYGLACIPSQWTKPFFVVSADSDLCESQLLRAISYLQINPTDELLVRSSGVQESLEERGSLVSEPCCGLKLKDHIVKLKRQIDSLQNDNTSVIHWLVQPLIVAKAKGHLSNERRLNKDLRDWVAEIEASQGIPSEAHRIAIRTWRDDTTRCEETLICRYRAKLTDILETVARWAYDRMLRIHFEWVWDGEYIFIVQADSCEEKLGGVDPKSLVQHKSYKKESIQLRVFRVATSDDYNNFRKLSNAAIYKNLGYDIGDFFVLDDQLTLRELIESSECNDDLSSDLSALTKRPLVIRTDGKSIPNEKKQMLPRSDELRSMEAARSYLIDSFVEKVKEQGIQTTELCLIAHHFIPATSSAWCKAHPDQRRVRIESLWGIPEGLYWYAYDVFDVDTQVPRVTKNLTQPASLKIRERLRYKERFIAPDPEGTWIVQQTTTGPDWSRSIQRSEWIKEIAWSSRKIANEIGESTVVMWLIDIPPNISSNRIIPWYHEISHSSSPPSKATPRKKTTTQIEHCIRSNEDWRNLKKVLSEGTTISRVKVEPIEPDLVRNQQFAGELAESAKRFNFVVELSGGILSHAYYMLSRAGCNVECIDLDDYATHEEEAEFNKLVRDNIPELIQSRGENVEVIQLEGEALIKALRDKLIEESFEVFDAKTSNQITEELADLLEVINALSSRLGIKSETIENIRKRKSEKRGAFDQSVMLIKTGLTTPLFRLKSTDKLSNHEKYSKIKKNKKLISEIVNLPKHVDGVHVDKRKDEAGTLERQFSFSMQVPTDQFNPPKVTFSLQTPDEFEHVMNLELNIIRDGNDLRGKIRLINAPTQLKLDFSDDNIN